jgi:hypothetical protein
MTTTPDDPFELDIKATAELDGQGDLALPPGAIASFFAGGAADRDAEIADARGMTYHKPPGHTRLAPLLGIRDEAVERGAEAGS